MIILKNVSKIYNDGKNEVHALKNIDLEIKSNKITAIVGQSGSGKTTLLNILGSLDEPTTGEVIVDDFIITNLECSKLAKYRNENVGFVFQSYFLEPNLKVIDNVAMPLCIAGIDKKTRYEKALIILEKLNLKSKSESKAKNLSGGEKQRVSIARALISNPSIILADEPTGNLDSKNGDEIINILTSIAHEGKTVILITHNQNYAKLCDEIITLADGEVIDKVTLK